MAKELLSAQLKPSVLGTEGETAARSFLPSQPTSSFKQS